MADRSADALPIDDHSVCKRAWKYHHAADELLHYRLQSFMTSQAVFAVPFVMTIGRDNSILETSLVFIAAFAIVVCLGFVVINGKMIKRLEFLKIQYLSEDKVYREYDFYELGISKSDYKKRKRSNLNRSSHRIIPFGLPIIFAAMWVTVTFIELSRG